MNKKILDAAVAVTFCFCLIASSNIQESNTEEPEVVAEEPAQEQEKTGENDAVTAGVSLTLSGYSFTTESDEETGIEKNRTIHVAAPEAVGESTEETETLSDASEREETEEQEQQTIANRWGITLTEEEIDLLARIVWLEASGESELGQEAVVEVIFNRMASEKYPNTLYEVLSQKNPVQFCSWKNRSIAKPTEKEYQSIQEVLNGNTNILRNDTLYFSTVALTPNLDVKIGGHSFCY